MFEQYGFVMDLAPSAAALSLSSLAQAFPISGTTAQDRREKNEFAQREKPVLFCMDAAVRRHAESRPGQERRKCTVQGSMCFRVSAKVVTFAKPQAPFP